MVEPSPRSGQERWQAGASSPRPGLVRAAQAAIVALVILALAGGAALRWWEGPRRERDRALHTTREFALALSSFDFTHLDLDLARLRRLGIGNFGLQYTQDIAAPAGRRKILDDQTVATARIVSGPYLASLHRDEARTFTALEQRVKDKRSAPPQLRRIRIDTILVRTPDGWKVDWAQVI